ncbi:MAG: hypothetical protein N3A59_08825 [Thermodesulfovibrionales bacterium]|nr:hypothetical protein [Thermodesulfovibrionales bacterium]
MKKIFLIIFFIFIPLNNSYASFEIKGLQPLPPFGVFSTFSAETLKQNQLGISLGFEKSSEPDINKTYLQLAYGLHNKFEINFLIPYVLSSKEFSSGFEDFSIGVKHRLISESKYKPALAYMLIVSAHSGKKQLSTEGGIGAGLILTKKVGPFKGHLNFIYNNPESSGLKDQYLMNIGSELAVTHSSKILFEITGRKNYFRNKLDLLEWRLGYRVKTKDNIFTSFGAGFDIKNRTPDYRLLFSISVILPKNKEVSY